MQDATWESAINPTTDAPSASVEAPEVVDEQPQPLEAQTETLETESPQLEVEAAAREGESQTEQATEEKSDTDEDIQEGDTPEILALPSGSSARKWARRQYADAEPTRKFLDFEKPISEFGDDLFKRSKSRYQEHVDDVLDHDADYASKKLFGLSFDEAKQRLIQTSSGAQDSPTPQNQPQQPTPADQLFTDAELDGLSWEQAERLRAFQEAQAQKESELKTQNDALQKRLDALEGKFTTKEQAEQQRMLADQKAEVAKISNDLYRSVWSVVDEEIRNTGLDVSKDDPPRIASLKRAALKLLSQESIEHDFDNDPEHGEENRKLVKQVFDAATRRERENAFREEDNLKVRARAAFQRVKSSPEVKAILSDIESYANSRTQQKRGIPAPPVPGASAGIIPKQPTTWDEAIAS